MDIGRTDKILPCAEGYEPAIGDRVEVDGAGFAERLDPDAPEFLSAQLKKRPKGHVRAVLPAGAAIPGMRGVYTVPHAVVSFLDNIAAGALGDAGDAIRARGAWFSLKPVFKAPGFGESFRAFVGRMRGGGHEPRYAEAEGPTPGQALALALRAFDCEPKTPPRGVALVLGEEPSETTS